MYNITIIFSMHKDHNNKLSNELYGIIENEKPDVIFEEFDISITKEEYYVKGHYKNQKESSVETKAIMKYLENNKIFHVPVDTFEIGNPPENLCNIISENDIEYFNLVKMNFILSCQHGFSYINSQECSNTIEKINFIEENIINKINSKTLTDTTSVQNKS